jgi:hypothetical protein
MSAWDNFINAPKNFGNAVKDVASGILGYGKAGVNLPGYATSSLATGLTQGQIAKTGVSPNVASQATIGSELEDITAYTVDQTLEGAQRIDEVLTPVVTALVKYAYKPLYRGAATLALAGNMDTYEQELNPLDSLKNAWNASADISLGQAVSDNFAAYANLLPDWGALAELNKVDIDIYNKEMRERVYLRTYDENGNRVDSKGNKIAESSWLENVWRNMSGAIDFTKVILLDPFIIGGKALKATRVSKLDVFRPDTVVKSAEWNAKQAAFAETIKLQGKEKLALVDEVPIFNRSEIVMQDIVDGNLYGTRLMGEVNSIRATAGKEPLDMALGETAFAVAHQNYLSELKTTIQGRQAKIEELTNLEAPIPDLPTGISDLVDLIIAREMTGPEISNLKVVRDYGIDAPFLGDTLAEAGKRGRGAVTDVLMIAGYGDPEALMRLRGQHEELVTMIDFQQNRLDRMENEVQQALGVNDMATVTRINAHKKELSDFIKAATADDKYLSRITREENNIVNALPGVPVSNMKRGSSIVEKYRSDKAIFKTGLQDGTIRPLRPGRFDKASSGFDWTRVSKSPLHGITYVAQWTGHRIGLEKPRGYITTSGLDAFEGVKDFQLTMNTTKYLKDDIELKAALGKEFVDASDSIGRKGVIEKAEAAGMDKVFIRYGIDPETPKLDKLGKPMFDSDGNAITLRSVIHNAYKELRIEKIDELVRERAFSIDSNGTRIMNPVIASELAHSVPFMDFVSFERLVKDEILPGDKGRAFMSVVRVTKDKVILPTYAKVDTFWRAEVLLRMGYPIRNGLTTGTILSLTDTGLGGMYTMPIARAGFTQYFENRYTHLLDWRNRLQMELDKIELTSEIIESSPAQLNQNLKAKALGLIAQDVDGVSFPKGAVEANELLNGLVPKKARVIRQFTPWSGKLSEYEQFATDYINLKKSEREGIVEFAKEILENPELSEAVTMFELKVPTETIARLDAQIALEQKKLLQIGEMARTRGERFGLKKIVGDDPIIRVGPIEFAGVYSGAQGEATRKLMSAAGTSAFDINPLGASLKEMGLEGTGKFVDIAPDDDMYFYHLANTINQKLRGSKPVVMLINKKSDKEILDYLATTTGREELKSLGWVMDVLPAKSKAPAERMAGKPPEGFFPAGSITPEISANNYLQYLKTQVIDQLLPSDELKAYVAIHLKMDEAGRFSSSKVTSAELRVIADGVEMNPINGEQLKNTSIFNNPEMNPLQKLDKIVYDYGIRRLFKAISVAPEDTALTHPYGNAVYLARMEEIISLWRNNGVVVTDPMILNAETQARKYAIQEVKRWMYRVVRKNGIAASIPAVGPFLNAQMVTAKQVGQLTYRNPDKAARVAWLWNQLNTNSFQNEEGERTVMWRVPRGWYDDKGLSDIVPQDLRDAISAQNEWKWNTPSFNLLLAGLRVPTIELLPGQEESTTDKVQRWSQTVGSVLGIGPMVQIVANEMIKRDPFIDQQVFEATGRAVPVRKWIEVFASPYPSNNMLDPLIGASVKRIGSISAGLKDIVFPPDDASDETRNNDYQRTKLLMFQNLLDKQATGEEPKYGNNERENVAYLWEEASKEAVWHLALRLGNNLLSPFVPSYEGPLTNAQGLYRVYVQKYGVDSYNQWINDYPDLAYIAISRTKNPSEASQTSDAAFLRNKFNDVIEEAIADTGLQREDALGLVGMAVNKDIGVEVLRDPRAGYWQRERGDRITLTAEQGYENSKIREGWAWYMNMIDIMDAKRREQGGISNQSSAANGPNTVKDEKIQAYGKVNPSWYAAWSIGQNKEATVGYIRGIETFMNNEEFRSSLAKDSYWFDLEDIISVRADLIRNMRLAGRSTPGVDMEIELEMRIAPYLRNPSTKFYWEKFLNNDNFLTPSPEDITEPNIGTPGVTGIVEPIIETDTTDKWSKQ